MADLVLIDTNAWITYFDPESRGMPKVAGEVERLIDEDLACYTEIILMELTAGIRSDAEVKRFEKAFLSVQKMSLGDGAVWDLAQDNARVLRSAGIKYKLIDLIIASVALYYDLRLFHHDKHFTQMEKKLKLREYNLLK